MVINYSNWKNEYFYKLKDDYILKIILNWIEEFNNLISNLFLPSRNIETEKKLENISIRFRFIHLELCNHMNLKKSSFNFVQDENNKRKKSNFYYLKRKTNLHYLRHLPKCIKLNGSMFTFYLALERFHQYFKLKGRKLKLKGKSLLINLVENELLRKFYSISELELGKLTENRKYKLKISTFYQQCLKELLNVTENEINKFMKLSQTQIIIFNYPHNYTTDNLISFFQNFNPKNAVLIKKKKTKKYFAFFTFPSCVIRDKALHLNGLVINERPITIKKAYKKLLSNSKKQITKNSKTPKLNSNNNSNHNNNQYENRINSLEKEILDLKEIITNLSKNNHKVIKNKNNNLYNNISSKKIQNKSDKGYIHSENEIKDKSNEIQIIKDSENESELSLLENLNPNINDSKTTQSSKRKEEELVYNQFLIQDKEFKEK
ncbi:heterogeneous nuclear ribonucleoprotein-related [Anaeramoeba flamelloides]|uniref:Heterogeneous nuclear ribonucleoprotein-related n=1 Tax=Anaeramoeba flamelloides TaxID=1746091 RepID=A0AAV7YMJ6_9EUKA|nr:heterogeneous nuclear ribonucleoprotein-related [Anaeramoeba flamelloides]